MRFIGLIAANFILLSVSSCQKDYKVVNLNGNEIAIVGHGGMGISSFYPINTAESFLKAIETGADGIEIDVQLTKDSVLVCFHNRDLEGNTNLSGLIHSKNFDELLSGMYQTSSASAYDIISLQNAFELLKNRQEFIFVLDCKKNTSTEISYKNYRSIYFRSLVRLINQNGLIGNVIVESQDTQFLSLIHAKLPAVKLMFYPADFQEGFEVASKLGLYGITVSNSQVTKAQVKLAHANNLRVALWNVNTRQKNKQAIEKNPDYIQTDRLSHLVKLLN